MGWINMDHLKTTRLWTHICDHMHRNNLTDKLKASSTNLNVKLESIIGCIDSPWTPWDKVFPLRRRQAPLEHLSPFIYISYFSGYHGAGSQTLIIGGPPSLVSIYRVLYPTLGFHSHYVFCQQDNKKQTNKQLCP